MRQAVRRSFIHRTWRRLRYSSRRWIDPYALPLVRRRKDATAVVRHVDRRSSRPCITPVLAAKTEDGFIFPLSLGLGADWYLDVEKSGHFAVEWAGQTYALDQPALIEPPEALTAFPRWLRWLLRLSGTPRYVRAHLVL